MKTLSRAIALTFAFGLSALPAAAQDTDVYLDGFYQQAVDAGESEVIIYNPTTRGLEPVIEAFEARFPEIRIKGVDLFGSKLLARVDSEYAAGGPLGDVVASTPADTPEVGKAGRLISFRPETAAALPEIYVGNEDQWLDWGMTIGGMFYNTSNVTAEDAPKSYADILDPKWKGRISMTSFRIISGTGQAFAAAIRDGVVDRAWFEGLAAQEPFVTERASAATLAVVNGQSDIGLDIPFHYYVEAKAKGAPIEMVFPAEGGISIPRNVGIFEGAKNINAAKLFVAWMFTLEAQAAIAQSGLQGTMPGAPGVDGTPEGLTLHAIDWKTLQENYGGYLTMFQEVFSQ
ncbi:extracellular solute-binding protein [Sulfitobacter sp. G21635-S1]|uniref:ABC transporter substrate-binding protein n=1 Tax=Sulfitobacter sp. G21635-S1 TaxID=3014043 RepID=UPI0022B02A25|nr:extracellular solute-binding protein [Sulfitobacter sp. G21635-S1]MCZ4256614.1 extracellular solute-binding protein [Sulfitobacter sp. G21635-S1]